ncbi:hypothetical protein GC088_10350 [Arthrobacter sp. JZ12]|uniref:hypothetical protein n=1 Tax=Arthrobacter sp. JZ12 TaxID=2654190 RepID=UPI002B48BF1A|nr:hypothetical protein [Arthrobacter sp. JZ12]WRH25422.1 hypothetical protein GC088_10350 [Arthrobacter sp. JZ12]
MLVRPFRPVLRLTSLAVLVLVLSGCRIEVPTGTPSAPPNAGTTTAASEPPASPSGSSAAKVELPPLPRAEIVGNDLTFDRGAYVGDASAVGFSDGMSRVPGWTQTKNLVNGESVYTNAVGCTAALRSTQPQDPLVVAGDDRASTEELFRFIDPSILPEYLTVSSWLWGASPDDSKASIEFLSYAQKAAGESPASLVSLRLFHTTRTALAFTVSCPADDALKAAVADVRANTSVIPPR